MQDLSAATNRAAEQAHCGIGKNMDKKHTLPEIISSLIKESQRLQLLAEELSALDSKANKSLTGEKTPNETSSPSQVRIIPFRPPACAMIAASSSLAGRFVPFSSDTACRAAQASLSRGCLEASPGKPLPQDVTDYRPLLQRNGLLLLSWDKRNTEMGERYTAYWVTSSGIPRFYASKSLPEKDFPLACPHHKSYAAEDGIEFYGQQAPQYIVHVAPGLMMNNPCHDSQRLDHIKTLKSLGSTVDFDYKYLLKTEKVKKRDPSSKKKKVQPISEPCDAI